MTKKKVNEPDEDLERDEPKYKNQVLTLTVPITPSVNHMYVNTKYGGKTLTKKAKEYIKEVQRVVVAAKKEQKWKKDKPCVWYHMDLYFYMPDKRIRDSHNCIKLLLDSLQGVLFENDYFVMPRIERVELDRENPKIDIVISNADD